MTHLSQPHSKRRRLLLLTEEIAPYRIPVFNMLAGRDDVKLHVAFLYETDPKLRQWCVNKETICFSYEVLPSRRYRIGRYLLVINRGIGGLLSRFKPDVILCGGYHHPVFWHVLLLAKVKHIACMLWCESNLNDRRPDSSMVRKIKTLFIHNCDGFVVPGKASRRYLNTFDIRDNMIFDALNAVDIRHFCRNTYRSPDQQNLWRSRLNLPRRFFLYVGRIEKEKGVFDLLDAYESLDKDLVHRVGLVFVGGGSGLDALSRRASRISRGLVRVAGFKQQEDLPPYYSLAEALVFPTWSDPWGLVVNEAMGCGLPVIASDVAGCTPDLVIDKWNGVIVPAGDVRKLTRALEQIAKSPELAETMGKRSLAHIQAWSPEACAGGIACAVKHGLRK